MDASRLIVPLLVLASTALSADPPPPNLRQPVDYVQWLNDEFGKRGPAGAGQAYLDAFSALRTDDVDRDVTRKRADRWTADERRRVDQWLAANEPALSRLAEATRSTNAFAPLPPGGSLVDLLMPYLSQSRSAGDLLAARAAARLHAGDAAAAAADLATLLRLSRWLQTQPAVIAHLVGIACAGRAYETIAAAPHLAGDKLDAEALLKALSAADGTQPSINDALTGEIATFCDMLQRWGKDTDADGKLDQIVMPFGEDGRPLDKPAPAAISPPLDPTAAVAAYQERMKLLRSISAMRYPERQAKERELSELGVLAPVRFIVTGLDRVDILRRTRDAGQNGARAVLRIHAYRRANGSWPATLKDAMKGESPTLRWDPFSGGELVYKIVKDDFLLYSLGVNGDDDGGKRGERPSDEKGDYVFWPLQ